MEAWGTLRCAGRDVSLKTNGDMNDAAVSRTGRIADCAQNNLSGPRPWVGEEKYTFFEVCQVDLMKIIKIHI